MNKPSVPPIYPVLPQSQNGKPARKLRVCIASFDFVGPVRNGGVGTAFTSLGEALAAAGHEVTLLFTSGQFCENGTLEQWVAYYKKKGIQFVPMPKTCNAPIGAPWYVVQSYHAYLWLLERNFDVIHFSEWKGPGYYTLLAKHQGTAFERTLLCVHTHGPTLWHKLSNSEFVTTTDDLENDFVERGSVKLADVVVSPSHYLFNWMKDQGWELPEKCYVQQYVRPATARKPQAAAAAARRIEELVFFGRLEHRKGLALFCDALDKLRSLPELAQVKVTFLGKPAEINGQVATEYIAQRSRNWPWKCQALLDRDQAGAMDYLQGGPRLAVLPSLVDNLPNTVLECLGANIPFIASNSGGIPEMIAEEDLAATLFSLRPAALAEKLLCVLKDGIRPARSAVEPVANERAWVHWHEAFGLTESAHAVSASLTEDQPLVSVCMAHWNRHGYLAQALASIEAQDYSKIEVVVVDDCSTTPETISYLDSLEPIFQKRGWQLLRQTENRFPGAARNRAAQAARGEYILFMDDDNVAKPNEISTFVQVARKTNADVLTCFLDTFASKTAPTAHQKANSRIIFLGDCASAGAIRNWFGDTNSLMRRESFLKLGGFHEEWGVNHEDYEFMARTVLRGYRLEVVPDALVWYRVNEGETSVLRSTPLHGNLMCSIRPYLEIVPPELRNLILLAQGMSISTVEGSPAHAKALAQYTELTVRWRSKLETGLALLGLNQRETAVNTMVEAIKSVETCHTPKVVLEALLGVGRHLKPLDPKRGQYLLELAVKLAKDMKHLPAQEEAEALLREPIKPAPTPPNGTHHFRRVKPTSAGVASATAGFSAPQLEARATSTPLVSIVIPTFNNLPLTRQCLLALQANTPAPAHEIIVVDNGSSDGTVDFLKAEQSAGQLRTIFNTENTGFAKACNEGARAAQGRYIVFLNNDTEVQLNWLGPLFSLAETDPAVAAVGSKLLYPNGTIQHAGIALADCWDHDPLLAFHLFAKEKSDFPLANQRRIYQAVTGACMLVRKSYFDQAGGFEEQYWNGYEDVDLCLGFQTRGWLTVYEPASVVIHHESQSGPERSRCVEENTEIFHRRWLEKASADVIVDAGGQSRIAANSVMRLYSAPSSKLVSIIILAYNQLRDTQQCLASIEKHTPFNHELILVDNGSTDGTGQFFRTYSAKHSNVRVILNRTNLGFSAGNNQGLACARGDFILLLNNDTVVTPNWLQRMLATFELYPDCGAIGPVSNSVSGPQLVPSANYSSLEQLPKFAAQWCAAHAGQSAEAARLVGFCLLLRRAVVEKIGALDPQFGNGNFEDDDLCIRTALAGFKLRIALDSFVHHTGGQTFKGAKIDYRGSLERNWELFKSKWAMPKETSLENGYRRPTELPNGVSLQLPLPDLSQTHVASHEDRCWTDKVLSDTSAKKPTRKASTIALPACAMKGHLGEARELVRKKQWSEAWASTVSAITARPYHPEAYLLLAEIASAASDADSARKCAKIAREMAPGWAPPKQFLKNNLRGNSKSEWLKLPTGIFEEHQAAPRISVCLIAKNEERFLAQCLKSVHGLASQIVVVDTGSTDRTIEIAREFGAEVHSFAWCDDFSAARNAALEHVTGDWILILDADEELAPNQQENLQRELQSAAVLGYRLPIIDEGREQDGCSYVPRLFRNAPGIFFVGRIHEQAFSSIQVRCQQWGLKHQMGKSTLLHHGYTSEVMASRNKIERNLRLLERAIEELPDEPNLVMSLGLELVRSGKLEAGLDRYSEAFRLLSALPAAEVTPELRETLLTQLTTHLMAAKRFSDIVQLWQNPFARNGGLTASQHFCLGAALMELKQPGEAAEQMRQCIEKRNRPALSPINPEILKAGPHHCLAICLIALQDSNGAEQAFESALAADPSSRPTRFDLARFRAAQGRTPDALKILRQLANENAGESRVWELGGQISLGRPEFLEFARGWTGEAVKKFPEDQTLLRQRAEALMLNLDATAALLLWRRAQNAGPGFMRARAGLVICELLTGDRQDKFTSTDEPALSQEVVQWYRQFIRMGANGLINRLNERAEIVRLTLPTFARVLEAAHVKARQVAA